MLLIFPCPHSGPEIILVFPLFFFQLLSFLLPFFPRYRPAPFCPVICCPLFPPFSNCLPVPKALPTSDFFRLPLSLSFFHNTRHLSLRLLPLYFPLLHKLFFSVCLFLAVSSIARPLHSASNVGWSVAFRFSLYFFLSFLVSFFPPAPTPTIRPSFPLLMT